jgi:serine/threonine-protein kinase
MRILAFSILGLALASGCNGGTHSTSTGPGPQSGVGIFPASSIFYEDIAQAPLDPSWPQIQAAVDKLGGFPSGKILVDFSISVLSASPSVPPRMFTADASTFFAPDCDTAPIPVPPGGAVEGQGDYACDTANNDCHLIVVKGARLYEAWQVNIAGGSATGSPFVSGCLALWDLGKDYWKAGANPYSRGDQCTSADAGGLPIAALLFSADEVAAGEIAHAIRFIMPNNRIRKDAYVHPATHTAGSGNMDVLPYGARLRLKASVDIAGLKPWAQVVARAMRKYGMILADGTSGSGDALTGESDQFTTNKWGNNLGGNDLSALVFDDFEMVDGGTRITYDGNCMHMQIAQ